MIEAARRMWFGRGLLALGVLASGSCLYAAADPAVVDPVPVPASAAPPPAVLSPDEARAALAERMLQDTCSRCHNDADHAAGFSVASLKTSDIAAGRHAEAWEKILQRVAVGEMQRPAHKQLDPAQMADFLAWIDEGRARYAMAHPDPGAAPVRRLNAREYANALRDLLGVEGDFAAMLPPDTSSSGVDTAADGPGIPPALMERYVAAAGKAARLAAGLLPRHDTVTTWQVAKDGPAGNAGIPAFNERAGPDLPLASRGGIAVRYFAPWDGSYDVAVWLNPNTATESERLAEDRHGLRLALKAGVHRLAVSFRRQTWPDEQVQVVQAATDATADHVPLPLNPPADLPLDVWVDGARAGTLTVPSFRMHPRYVQAHFPRDVLQLDVAGPFEPGGNADLASRRALFVCQPRRAAEEAPCARRILSGLARRAWRGPVSEAELAPILKIHASQSAADGFDSGIAAGIEALLVSPGFLLAIEAPPPAAMAARPYPVADRDLALRLSLFLWSSIPDERLLALAGQGKLHVPAVLTGEITRMLADPRALALSDTFAGPWLPSRNLDQQQPGTTADAQIDGSLRAAMARETRMVFAHVLRANRPLTDFIRADYTFLNEALARHYGIGGVRGPAFRKVALAPDGPRGGLQQAPLDRREAFASAFTARLMAHALGRALGPNDMPPVRAIAQAAAKDEWRVHTIIRGIVMSPAFTMRRAPGAPDVAALAARGGKGGR